MSESDSARFSEKLDSMQALEVCRKDIPRAQFQHGLNVCGMQCTSYYIAIGYLHSIKAGCKNVIILSN